MLWRRGLRHILMNRDCDVGGVRPPEGHTVMALLGSTLQRDTSGVNPPKGHTPLRMARLGHFWGQPPEGHRGEGLFFAKQNSLLSLFSANIIPYREQGKFPGMSKGNSREKAGQLNGCPSASNLCFGNTTKAKEEGILLNMSQIDDIRDRARKGCRLAEIARATGHDVKTVRKYLEMDDFSPRPPVKKVLPSKLDPYKAQIDRWLAEDEGTWRKQWHTAQRIHDRLTQEVPGYDCSYSTVQRYVKAKRRASGERALLELTWHPGESQADFGEADFQVRGSIERCKYLTLSFLFSNNGFSQV